MGRGLLVGLLVAAAGCAQPKLQSVEGNLRVTPGALEVKGFAGFPIARTLTVSNTGRAALTVAVATTPGLTFIGEPGFTIAGGQSLEVQVQVTAAVAGVVGEEVGFSVEGARVAVPVTGELLVAPTCAAAEACHAVRFDPVSGTCVDSLLADGSACAAACLETARCQAGSCVGTPRSCDDGNKCTQDACDATGGCTHVDTSAMCPAPCESGECGPDGERSALCQAPACDPLLGCTTVSVADGIACGPNDCSTAHVCMAGMCQAVAAPEGSTCSEATPCQTSGKCVTSQCVSSMQPLVPTWQVLSSAKVSHRLLGVVSPGGLVFGLEAHDVGIFVVAYDGSGFERWRTAFLTEFGGTQALYDVARAQLLVTSKTWVRAFDGVTGAQKWFVDLSSEIPANDPGANGVKVVYPAEMALLPASKQLVTSYSEGNGNHAIWVFGLDLLTGKQMFKTRRDGHLYGLMTTATDELFIGSAGCWAPASWAATYDAAGIKKWDVFQPGVPSLTSGSQLYYQPYGATSFLGRLDLVTGAMSQEAPNDDRAILALGSRLFLTSTASPRRLTAWDATAHQPLWVLDGVPLTQTFLTDTGGVLGLSDKAIALVSRAGKPEWTCDLALTSPLSSSLLNGQLIAQTSGGISAFAVPKVKISATGWSVSERGSPEKTNRAR